MRLNVGCGEHYATGWTNIDLHDHLPHGPRPDTVCTVLDLPFDDGTAERVYCGHVLEHVSTRDLPTALHEISRVLDDNGVLMVVGPDLDLVERHEPALMVLAACGSCRWAGDEHRSPASGPLTVVALRAAGFTAEPLPVGRVRVDEWPLVDAAPWQFAVRATKEKSWLAP